MMSAGVRYNGRILMVEFEVTDGQWIDIVGVVDYTDGKNASRRIEKEDSRGKELITSGKFRACAFWAIADYNQVNFDYDTFVKELN